MPKRAFRPTLLLGAALMCLASGVAEPAPRPRPPAPAGPPPAGPPPAGPAPAGPAAPRLPEPPLPVQQARAVGLERCVPVLDRMSREALTSLYDVQSGWSQNDPTGHVFQSIAALNTPGNTPPDGFAALIAAPLPSGGCDGVALQVFPLAGDCPSAQRAMLAAGGRLMAPLLNTRIMLDARGNRITLVPAYNNTCIAVAVDTRFGGP